MREPALNALIGFQQAIASQIDFTALRDLGDRFRTALPTNLRDVEDLEAVAAITLEEGIPLAWVPNAALIDELLACPSAEARMNFLDERRDVVLDDCTEVLDGITDPWATAARQAIDAMRGGYSAPAQSHAANLIDSIVLAIAGDRAKVMKHAHADVMRMPFLQAGQALVLRPLARALTRWYVTDATPPPDFFARHVVCHGVGRDGVFSERNALIGVMLATSLVVEFVDVEDAVVVA
jgi:hypothetical protein